MKAKYLFFISLAVWQMGSVTPVKASHLLGADIAWQSLGADTFLVSVTVYRDCNGIPMPAQPLNVYACGSDKGTLINTIKTGGMDITPVCKGSCSRCGNTGCNFALGIEEYTFSAKINFKALNPGCCHFKITWESCCRNGAITTGAAAENYYVDADINPCLAPGDNSPVFNTRPVMIYNVNQCLTFSFGAYDPDTDVQGRPDSLVYLLDTPYQAMATPVDFDPGYAFNAPLKYNGASPNDPWYPDCKGFHLDPLTGDLLFKAEKEDIAILNVLVQEWGRDANGKPFLKGDTHRDITFFTMSSPDNTPTISGINGGNTFSIEACVGKSTCFTVGTDDQDAGDSVSVTSIMPPELAKAYLNISTDGRHPQAYFCWQPDAADAGKTYRFVLNASDNACPLTGRVSRTYSIHVNPLPTATDTVMYTGCGNTTYKVFPGPGSQVTGVSWSGDDGLSGAAMVLNHHYRKAGTYRYKVRFYNASGCGDTLSGVINIPAYLNLDVHPEDTLFCYTTPADIHIKAKATGGSPPYTFTLSGGASQVSAGNADFPVQVRGDTTLLLQVTGQTCTNRDTIRIRASKGGTPVHLLPPNDTTVCYQQAVNFKAVATGGDSTHYVYLWTGNPPVQGNTYTVLASSSRAIHISLTDGCSADSATLHLTVRPQLLILMSAGSTICPGNAATLLASGVGGNPAAYRFTWDRGLGSGALKTVQPYVNTSYKAVLTDGCSAPDTGNISVSVLPLPVVRFSANQFTAIEGQQVQFSNQTSGATDYIWKFGDGSTSTLDSLAHTFKDSGSYSISLIATSLQGCTDSLVKNHYITILPAFHLFIPNAFTPDKDSLNDCFMPEGRAYSSYTLQIFSRLGNIVYRGNTCWNGEFKGSAAPEGMYIYHLSATDIYGTAHSYEGPFYLLRH